MKPIVVLGSLNMDLVLHSPRLPQPGETLLGGPFQTFPGGKGANQAVAIARLGTPVMMIGRVGKDAYGGELISAAKREGVDTHAVSRDPATATGVALITVETGGENTIVVAPGANGRLTPEHVQKHFELIRDASLLVMQLEIPLETVIAAARLAHQAGTRVLLNPAPAQPLPGELLRMVDVLAPNEMELALIAGEQAMRPAAQRLVDRGVPVLVVTLGSAGVFVTGHELAAVLPGFPVSAIDTVAAGDAFIGAFAVALVEGKPLMEAAQWGNAAGAIAVTRQGAQPSLPTREEVLRMLGGDKPGLSLLR